MKVQQSINIKNIEKSVEKAENKAQSDSGGGGGGVLVWTWPPCISPGLCEETLALSPRAGPWRPGLPVQPQLCST